MYRLCKISYYLILLLLLWSCSSNVYYEDITTLPRASWDRKQILSFSVPVDDTISSFDVFIIIRNTGNYSRRNLYLFITIINPSGEKLRDTVNCILADEKGRWYGKSNLGDLYYNCFLYKSRVRFPVKGTYRFLFEQAMRSPVIDNIEDVGLKIERLP